MKTFKVFPDYFPDATLTFTADTKEEAVKLAADNLKWKERKRFWVYEEHYKRSIPYPTYLMEVYRPNFFNKFIDVKEIQYNGF